RAYINSFSWTPKKQLATLPLPPSFHWSGHSSHLTLLLRARHPSLACRAASSAAPLAVAVLGAAVLVAAASAALRPKAAPSAEPPSAAEAVRAAEVEAQRQAAEELRSMLPEDLEEALKDFEGDFCGPWRALGLEADVELDEEDLRVAYRRAVRVEHPDTSQAPDAEERFQRVRKAYALLSDEGTRELLLEAIEQQASCFAELSGLDLADEEAGPASSLPSWLFLLPVLLALLLAFLLNVSGEDMQMRPRQKEPAVLSLQSND
ncbi:unnamed protein product, partial [Durusdinium trenchii]